MSNVVPIGLPKRPGLAQRQQALVQSFARHRRRSNDVFWLKENAELLNILRTGGASTDQLDLSVYEEFYRSLEDRLRYFPQYYRFLLSICLDFEDLRVEGDVGVRLCKMATDLRLADAELSDLQRAEAQCLIARRSGGSLAPDLEERLRSFMAQKRTFALPNKKAGYELTHIVFYLSDYGARPLDLGADAETSLEYVGLLAFLDQDVDLLSEVCVAMRFSGRQPSPIWENWLADEITRFKLVPAADGPVVDAYHEYFVTSWWAGLCGYRAFQGAPSGAGLEVSRSVQARGPLRSMSELLYQLGAARSGDWTRMRDVLHSAMDEAHHKVLEDAARSSNRFDAFFEGFARA